MIATPNHFHHATPVLRVRDLAASLGHYRRVLVFKLDWDRPFSEWVIWYPVRENE